jgi:N-acetylneuraminic acid mutarotase
MPTARARLSASAVDGKIYAIGGSPHGDAEVAAVEVYDPATDTWMKKADMPRARNWFSTSVVNGKIYAIGGKIYPSEAMVSTVEAYDPMTDSWIRKANMPTVRGMHSASVVDGKIYVIGGITGTYGPWVSTVEAYDPMTDTWTKKADMPTARTGHSSSALYGKIYVVGGGNSWESSLSTVEVYDPVTDTWARETNMPTARLCHSSSTVNGKIYVIGGTLHPSSWVPISTVEVYDPGVPPPDFNGDGFVEIKDLLRLIESWGQDDPLVDIAPPCGDGIIDIPDLEALMAFWGQEVNDPTLAAHWRLDEAEGIVAYDTAGNCDATACGEPLWQPDGGAIGGALALDGADDFLATDFVLDPLEGPFSVLARVQGDVPGRVILSQVDGANWFCTDPTSGCLMTELKGVGRDACALCSDTIITDGTWHRIALVCEGEARSLYVDEVLVAEDTQAGGPADCTGGLNIGCDKDMAPGTFFSGLIDDVRIYNRAVRP